MYIGMSFDVRIACMRWLVCFEVGDDIDSKIVA